MSAGKHTEGPWTVCLSMYDGSVFSFSITASPHGSLLPICEAPARLLGHNRPPDEMEANAHLIAAAPEMLATLRECLKAEEQRARKLLPGAPASTYSAARLARVRAAIAKAEGRADA